VQNICTTYGEGDIELSKTENSFKNRLMWYLLGVIVFSAAIAFGCGYLLVQLGNKAIERIFNNEEVNKTYQYRYMEDLQDFVTTKRIGVANIDELNDWTEDNSYVYVAIYQNNRVIFNSDYSYTETVRVSDEETESAELQDSHTEQEPKTNDELIDSDKLYTLVLTDGSTASVDMFCYDYWKYNNYLWIFFVGLAVCIFIIILAKLLKVKFSYINQIEKELQILEGGNLEYPITIKGEDEIGNLARGIEQMRLSIIENQDKEKKMQQANKDLVTAMSHDLRTPLTTLTGYLEILNMDHEKSPEQRKRFLQLSLDKTKEIKDLSDELFEYFLIYGEDRHEVDVEAGSAYGLVMDLIENQFLSLEEEGYQIVAHNHIEEGEVCLIHVRYMQRVLNNILSNLNKYADKAAPIEIIANKEQNYLVLRIRNKVKENLDKHESTNIGLITCERIMRLQHGEFKSYEVEGEFTVKLVIPLMEGRNE